MYFLCTYNLSKVIRLFGAGVNSLSFLIPTFSSDFVSCLKEAMLIANYN